MSVFSQNSLQDKVILITGGCGGIGEVIVKALVAHGARVAVNDAISEPPRPLPAGATYFRANITDEKEVEQLFQDVVKEIGRPNVVCCHAGMVESFPILEYPLDNWRKLIDLNVNASFLVAREAARLFTDAPPGRGPSKIVFTSSWVQDVPWPDIGAYTTSKSGLKMLMKGMARELADRNVTVNAIAPGIVGVGMAKRQWDTDPNYRKRAERAIPLGKLQDAKTVADGFLFLCSDASNYMTGSTLTIDGGCSLYPLD